MTAFPVLLIDNLGGAFVDESIIDNGNVIVVPLAGIDVERSQLFQSIYGLTAPQTRRRSIAEIGYGSLDRLLLDGFVVITPGRLRDSVRKIVDYDVLHHLLVMFHHDGIVLVFVLKAE